MTTIPDTILIACLDALENGESAAQIMSRYPEHVAELRPFLDTAVLLQELPPPPPEIAAELSKKAFLQEAGKMKTAAVPQPPQRSWLQVLRPVLALALVLIALSVTLLSASNAALPGDTLYTTKRFVEDVRLSRTTNPVVREKLVASFKQERLREINTLLQAGRSAVVSFSGQVEAIADTQWMISGILVKVTPDTTITGTIVEGVEAEVNGRIAAGQFTAITISLPDTDLPEPEPTSTPLPPTKTPLPPTKTPLPPTATKVTPTATPVTPTATPIPPTLTATPSPTPGVEEASPTPTPTDVPDDAGNDNDPDNSDDNSGSDNGGDDDNANEGDDNSNSGDDNANEGDDNSNSDGDADDDNANDDSDNANDNDDDHSGSGGGDNDNDNDDDHFGSGGGDNDNDNDDDHSGSGGGGDDNSNDNEDDHSENDNGGG